MKRLKHMLSSKKAKVLTTLGAIGLLSTNAMADITYTAGSGFSGTIDLTSFYTAVAIIVTFLGVIFAVKTSIAMFKR